jgi:lipopolysaccharide transport system ATP-binding protein
MSQPVITVENLGKCYTIGRQRCRHEGMRHALENAVRAPLAWLRSRREADKNTDFWALKDVSFQIAEGETVGIIGRNGAGKSTLLKLLSRITVPTKGRIRINDRIASLLEVGTGFHPELTGRENIFLNGAILGMTRVEIVRKFDEIVEFSEIEEFLDTPVKRYSSGMYVRLAFAVAAHLEPEILIVDEVLAVGDAAFQKKCLGKMGSFARSGKTVLFVSHNMDAVRNLCQKALWLKNGRLHREGSADRIVEDYFAALASERSFSSVNQDYGLAVKKVSLKNSQGEETGQFSPGDEMIVEIDYEAQKRVEQPSFALGVVGMNSSCFTANMLLDGHRPSVLFGPGKISCRFLSMPLLPQDYVLKMYIRAKNGRDMILEYQDVAYFSVIGDLAKYGFKGDHLTRASYSTHVMIPYEWQLPDGTIAAVALESASKRPIGSFD